MLSGTSVDGIDVAVVDISHSFKKSSVTENPIFALKQIAFQTIPFTNDQREIILKLMNEKCSASEFCRGNFLIGEWFADAILDVLKANDVDLASIDVIGSHGQTIWHEVYEEPIPNDTTDSESSNSNDTETQVKTRQKCHSTFQLGEAAVIAHKTNTTVISDFRVADVAAGGMGAPLTSM